MTLNTRNVKYCDNNHNTCINMVNALDKALIAEEIIDNASIKLFFELIFQQTIYSYSCLSSYYNKNYQKILSLIDKLDNKNIIIEPMFFAKYCQFVDDKNGFNILTNQSKLDKNYCDKLHQEFNDAMRGKKKKTKSASDLLKQKYINGDKKKEELYKKELDTVLPQLRNKITQLVNNSKNQKFNHPNEREQKFRREIERIVYDLVRRRPKVLINIIEMP
jgi:hypothetical protein